MADTELGDLAAASNLAAADLLYLVQSGAPKKVTLAQLNDYTDPVRQAITSTQAPSGNTDTYITGSRIVLPQSKMQAGTYYRCEAVLTKTAAGTATPVFNIRTGTAGTTADTSRLSYTGVAQTAAADVAFVNILCTFRVVGASAVLASWFSFSHDLAATGFANAQRAFQGQSVSAAFDSTSASMGIGWSVNPGASAVWTVQQCIAELRNLAD